MSPCRLSPSWRAAFTLIELLVVVAIIALLISILLPSLSGAREQAKRAKCGANLSGIGKAVAACFTENRDHGPTWDDGEPGPPSGKQEFMATWVDVLFDTDYLGDNKAGICPNDERPDPVAERRGQQWGFRWVETAGISETPKFGTRTSYGITAPMHFNFKEDRFPGRESHQVYALDSWWTWVSGVNAAWIYNQNYDPFSFPSIWSTMTGWRHTKELQCNILYLDFHVSTLTPYPPLGQADFLTGTVDTNRTFTWLPGELSGRFYQARYGGQIDEWDDRIPKYEQARASQNAQNFANNVWSYDQFHPYSFPPALSAAWRTHNAAWRKIGVNSDARR